MNKCYLDSNVLVYWKDNNSPHQYKAIKLIKTLRPDSFEIYISSLTLDEFLHASKFILKQSHISQETSYVLLNKALSSILALPHFKIINPSTDKNKNKRVLLYMKDYNLSPRDAYHLLIMKENGISEFATFDSDFKKVFTRKVLKPKIN